MIERQSRFERPLASLCILAALGILSLYIIFSSDGGREDSGEISYRVTLRHYGSDAHEMERTAAIPLEDALSAIPGINQIMTLSENGSVRAYVSFRRSRRGFFAVEDDYYESVREAAQRVYETLPPSAQRPELSSSDDFRIPFWTAAVYGSGGEELPDGVLLERTIKPALSGIDGIGEVEIAGPGIREIVITLDQEKSAALGLSPASIAKILANNDALFIGGFFRYESIEIPLRLDGRYLDLETLGEALIPLGAAELLSPNAVFGSSIRLKAIADIREQEREADTLSRLNGKKTAVISVTAASGTDPGLLSNRIKKEIEKFSSLPIEFRVLEDRGAEEAAAFRSVFAAALKASFLVALAAILLGIGKTGGLKNALICAAAIPLILVISAAILSAMGFPLNRKFLAGLAVGIGGAVDAVILSAEGFGRARHPREGKTILRGIWPPLFLGAATSVAALLPLAGMSDGGDITVIINALAIVTLVSVALALTFLPPLFLSKSLTANYLKAPRAIKSRLGINSWLQLRCAPCLKKIERRLTRSFAALIRFCIKKPLAFPAVSLFVSLAALLAIAAAGADTGGEWAEDSVYVQVEFEGGFLKEEGDTLLASWAADIGSRPGVREVQTGARTGSGYGLVTFDPRITNSAEIRNFVRSKTIPGAFIFIPEPSADSRIWNITVSGDDADKCRELARTAAALCSRLPFVKETVLNFKDGGPRLTLVPRRELLAQGGMHFSTAADTLRRGLHGPVAYKRNNGNGESDVRIRFGSPAAAFNGDDILRIPLAVNGNTQAALRIGTIMEAEKSREVSGIRRENRRRIASFSVGTDAGDPRFFRDKIMDALKDMELPPAYRIEFDPDAIRQAEALSGKLFALVLAVLFCYMIIAAVEESFVLPLIILSAIPLSLAVPVLILVLSGASINSATACALVAVSGMSVSASVISAGELWRRSAGEIGCYRILRGRIPALLAMTGTTIAGALPFLFLREGANALVRTLALVSVLGVATSFFCSLTLVPSLVNLYFRFRGKRKSCSALRSSITSSGVLR